MIAGVTNSDALPVLERLLQFSAQRHQLIAHNIANFDTPNFQPQDVSVDSFQTQLAEATDQRRDKHGNIGGDLNVEDSHQVTISPDGMQLHPEVLGENVLFHDRNDRSVEHIMQDLVENFMTFRTTAQLIRSRFDLINTAIRERI